MTELSQPADRRASIGTAEPRHDGPAKVTGSAPYAFEHPAADPAYGHLVTSAVARGRITALHTDAARALPGVLAVLSHLAAPALADTSDAEFAVLQSDEVAFRGQIVALVVAEDAETAREAARLVGVEYEESTARTVLDPESDALYCPESVNGGHRSDTRDAAVEGLLSAADHLLDATYRTPMQHQAAMEPHTTTALWQENRGHPSLTLYDSTQNPHGVRRTLATVLGLPADAIRCVAHYVGGGFGSKGLPHANVVAAALAARAVPGRTVRLPLTRQQTFTLGGHRTPTVQRVRLGADEGGRIRAISHEAWEHTSRIKEFAEQTAAISRMMYTAEHRTTAHRLLPLDVPVPTWMRAPGEAPGSYALEVAVDELAELVGVDPIELRVRNEPPHDPETGKPWSSRRLVDCLREGAEWFGWDPHHAPRLRREGRWRVGHGVAAATYPGLYIPGTKAEIERLGDGRYAVRTGAVDLGTGAWTVLAQIAADALDCPLDRIALELGDTRLPRASVAGGSTGTACWGSAIVGAARAFRAEHGSDPRTGARTLAGPEEHPEREQYAIHSFGAHFVEVRIDADTGEVRVPRMRSVFSAGRIINPVTARSQFVGAMIMGVSAALHEENAVGHGGALATHDLAGYHVASHADVGDLRARWLEETDPAYTPIGARGIGEIGIVGAAAAVANATYDATGLRIRQLPLTPDHFLP
ncbi:xanthine dehydrogenase family protein molybdopterin-binding subunit [Streptomyces tardus]|uniref:xanthine dehydrogenase family protein molybdopterin-binding subunit n=1 Tax=Streptomyces tardus TaxID=2780544 RepID=UPI0027E48C1A|nr:xanthine dehydrogenase family protein molybdopterin-binding subunit [Streptomyces tardus]